MAVRFSIGAKISTGFGILILSVVVAFYITYQTMDRSVDVSEEVTKFVIPSVQELNKLKLHLIESKRLIFIWATIQSPSDDPNKRKLDRIIKYHYPGIKKELIRLSEAWDAKSKKDLRILFKEISRLFKYHKEVRIALPDYESYNEPRNEILAKLMVSDDGNLSKKADEAIYLLDELINYREYESEKKTKEMQNNFGDLELLFKVLGIMLTVASILIALLTTRMITIPVNKLKHILLRLSKGVFPEGSITESNDEIGEMTRALNKVVYGLKETKDFANAVGSGHFDTTYNPLSDDDVLGHALIKMREDLAENERLLEDKVKERTIEVVKQKEEIEHQNRQISDLYEEVTDSIKYAKGLQESMLPQDELIKKAMPESFILYKPKDIVSGDFYWVEEKNDKIYFAAVDCTGHGVPGAFMSIIGHNSLNQSLRQNDTPGAMLDAVNKRISSKLHHNSDSGIKDGMDLALCCYDKEKRELQYAGAYNPLYIIRDNEIIQIKADKFPVGSYFENKDRKYTNHTIELKKGDNLYVFSDGFADQFGGPNGKKFMYHRFRESLLKLANLEMKKQGNELDQIIRDWKGTLDQVDDILVIGMHVE